MDITILEGDVTERLQDIEKGSVQCVVTSPPYWGLRDYGHPDQIGLESDPYLYCLALKDIFHKIKRVLRDDGTVWLNLGDCYTPQSSHKGGTPYDNFKDEKNWGERSRAKDTLPSWGKPKDLVGIPWMVAFALKDDGWYLRSDIVWYKPNPMPESVTDRPTRSHEYIFLFSKKPRYYYDYEAILEPTSEVYNQDPRPPGILRQRLYPNSKYQKHDYGSDQFKKQDALGKPTYTGFNDRWKEKTAPGGASKGLKGHSGYLKADGTPFGSYPKLRNKRSVWTVTTQPFPGAHFATFPEDLIEPCIKAGSRIGDTVLDPFAGSGTTGLVARRLNRKSILIELNPSYVKLMKERLRLNEQLNL